MQRAPDDHTDRSERTDLPVNSHRLDAISLRDRREIAPIWREITPIAPRNHTDRPRNHTDLPARSLRSLRLLRSVRLDVDQRRDRCDRCHLMSISAKLAVDRQPPQALSLNPMFTDRTLHLDAGMPLEDTLRKHGVTYNKLAYSVL